MTDQLTNKIANKPQPNRPLIVILDNIRSALNVGAMFRTADGAGVEKIFLTGITPYPPHNRIPKTALGAIQMVDWEYQKDTTKVINKLKNSNYQIVAVELTNQAEKHTDFKFKKPTCLIFGNEISGITNDILDLVDNQIYIPMFGEKKSLNVATSFGIVIYEVVRQWTGNS